MRHLTLLALFCFSVGCTPGAKQDTATKTMPNSPAASSKPVTPVVLKCETINSRTMGPNAFTPSPCSDNASDPNTHLLSYSEDTIEAGDVYGLRITGATANRHIKSFQGLNALKILELNQTQMTHTALIQVLAALPLLEVLSLQGDKVDDALVLGLHVANIPRLNLSRSAITAKGLNKLTAKLKTLRLAHTSLGDDATQALTKYQASLTHLDLSHTAITDASVKNLSALKSLKTLDVQATKLTPDAAFALRQALPATHVVYDKASKLYAMDQKKVEYWSDGKLIVNGKTLQVLDPNVGKGALTQPRSVTLVKLKGADALLITHDRTHGSGEVAPSVNSVVVLGAKGPTMIFNGVFGNDMGDGDKVALKPTQSGALMYTEGECSAKDRETIHNVTMQLKGNKLVELKREDTGRKVDPNALCSHFPNIKENFPIYW